MALWKKVGVDVLVFLLVVCSGVRCQSGVDFDFSFGSEFEEVNEEEPIGTTIVDVDASYQVLIGGGLLITRDESYGSYTVQKPDSAGRFAINASTGALSNAVLLDREAGQTSFPVTVTFAANDGSANGSIVITVSIFDINDNAPNFTQSVYEVAILESTAPGTKVYQVVADDPDQVLKQQEVNEDEETLGEIIYVISNGRVLYSITDGNEDGDFTIDPDSGDIIVSPGTDLDIDVISSYNLTIVATDGGGLTDTATLLIDVLDANDNTPIIHSPESFSRTLSEDTPPGLVLVEYINATDDDYGQNAEIHFEITSGDVTSSFSIDLLTGKIVLVSNLDRESSNPYVLTVVAIDNGIPERRQSNITITINVLDINDSPPTFTESTYSIMLLESSPIGSTLSDVAAIDQDSGENGTIYYTLTSSIDGFTINNITGIITINVPLDYEEVPLYNLTVVAVDTPLNKSQALTGMATVLVTIVDVNDNHPQWGQDTYSVGVLDTEAIGYVVTTLTATDADSDAITDLQYNFVEPFDAHFAIAAHSGNVTIEELLDFGTKSFYNYSIRVSDGIFEAYTMLEITVHTTNKKKPKFQEAEYSVTVYETAALNTVILNVTAKDKDPGLIGEVRYRIPSEVVFTGSGAFNVTEESGGIYPIKRLDYDFRYILYVCIC